MRVCSRVIISFFVFCMFFSTPHVALCGKAAPQKSVIDAKAADLFETSCAYLAGLKGFSLKAELLLDLVYQGKAKVQIARNMDLAVKRPNAFRIDTTGDDMSVTSVFTGKTFTMALLYRHLYNQAPFDKDTDALLDFLAEKHHLDSPLGDLLRNKPCADMSYASLSYMGLGFVGAARCHHLFFQGGDIDWQIWIEDGAAPLPRKLVITEKRLPMAPQFTAFLRDWTLAEPAAAVFDYTPPANFTRDDNLFTHLRIEAEEGARYGK